MKTRLHGALLLLCLLAIIVAPGCPTTGAPPSGDTPVPSGETQGTQDARLEWGCAYLGATSLNWAPRASGDEVIPLVTELPSVDRLEARVAPNGKKVAWATAGDSINVHDLLTGETRRLADLAPRVDYWEGSLRWSGDGNTIAYTDGGNLFAVGDENGGKPRLLAATGDVTDLCWSPDGQAIAYCRRSQLDEGLGLWRVSALGGDPVELVPGTADVFAASGPEWSPDGERIAFLCAWEGGVLCMVDADGRDAAFDVQEAWFPVRWLSDSSAVLFNSASYPGPSRGVRAYSIGGGVKTVVEGGVVDYDLSEKGDLVVAVAGGAQDEMSSPTHIILGVVSGVPNAPLSRDVARFDGVNAQCVWLPGGKSIAAIVQSAEGPGGELFVCQAEEAETQTLASGVYRLVGPAVRPQRPGS